MQSDEGKTDWASAGCSSCQKLWNMYNPSTGANSSGPAVHGTATPATEAAAGADMGDHDNEPEEKKATDTLTHSATGSDTEEHDVTVNVQAKFGVKVKVNVQVDKD